MGIQIKKGVKPPEQINCKHLHLFILILSSPLIYLSAEKDTNDSQIKL